MKVFDGLPLATIMYKLVLCLGLLAQVCACTNNASQNVQTETAECDSCVLNFKHITPTQLDSNSNLEVYKEAAVIELFYLVDDIEKFDGVCQDSLPAKFANRQLIYSTLDEFGIYSSFVRGNIIQNKIEIIKPKRSQDQISFLVEDTTFTVDLSYFKENVGAIFYKPNQQSVLWTSKSYTDQCNGREFVECFFGR